MTEKTEAEKRKDEAKKEEDLRRRGELVKASPGLMPYGTPQELAEMVGRVKFMVPGGDKLKNNEVWALAQAAFTLGLNPIIGECWWIPGLGFMPGIKGVRRVGREQLEKRGATMSTSFPQITSKADFEKYKIPLEALAYFCEGYNSEKRHAWVMDAKILREALGDDAPYEAILENIGSMPLAIGVGYITKEQMDELDNPRWYHVCKENKESNTVLHYKKMQRELRGQAPCPDCEKKSYAKANAMPHVQRAQKRAEAHMWKQECDLPFNIQIGGEGLGEGFDMVSFPDAIDVPFLDEPEEEIPSTEPPPPTETTTTTPPITRVEYQWEEPILERLVDLGLAKANKHAVNILEQSPFKKVPYGDLEIVEAVAYFIGRQRLKKEFPDMESQERADLMNKAWEDGNNDDCLDKAIELLRINEGKK